jgi:two-component system NtrC family sensor kinase
MRSTNTAAVSWVTARDRRAVLLERRRDAASFVECALREDGYSVDECETAAEAMACLNEHPVDVIVVNLPALGGEGIALRDAQRADPSLAGIPLVAVVDPKSSKARAHADAWLIRPFSAGELLVAIDRALLQRERRALRERFADTERLALLGTIAASIGHDLNNPLSFSMGNLELAEEALASLRASLRELMGGPAGVGGDVVRARLTNKLESLTACFRDSRLGLVRVGRMVTDLANLAKKASARHRAVDITSVVRQSVSMAKGPIDDRAVLTCEYCETTEVMGDELRLGQLFVNLLVNAAQSIPEGEASSNRIHVATYEDGDSVIVDIEDTGGGMSKTQLSRIFEPFFTTKTDEGTGLGLPICRDIVAEHGGRLDVESELGRGSRFTVRLPGTRAGRAG